MATHSIEEIQKHLDVTLQGLTEEEVENNREKYGTNKVTKEKKKPLFKKLAEAFINPFTVVLFAWPLYPLQPILFFPCCLYLAIQKRTLIRSQ